MYSTSQLRQATFQILNRHMWLEAIVLNGSALDIENYFIFPIQSPRVQPLLRIQETSLFGLLL